MAKVLFFDGKWRMLLFTYFSDAFLFLISFSMFSVCWAVAVMNLNPLNCSHTSSVHAIAMNKASLPKTILFVLSRKMNSSVSFFLLLLNWRVHSSSMQQVSKKTIASYSWLHVPVIVHLSLNMCVCLSNVFLFSETKQNKGMCIDRERKSPSSQTTDLIFPAPSAPWARTEAVTANKRRGTEKRNHLWWQHEIVC